ncbi:MAG: cupin domain-containing protein [Ferruginibacter sp.]
MPTASYFKEHYQMQAHPEGGWYRETYRSADCIRLVDQADHFPNNRNYATAIYFLLEHGQYSAFHKIKSDECWHFYAGDPLDVLMLDQSNGLTITKLGPHAEAGEVFQFVVPANTWFASRPSAGSSFSFVGCTVSPGFDFADFELADASSLTAVYPEHAATIHSLCR